MHRLYEFSHIGMCASAEGEYILFEVNSWPRIMGIVVYSKSACWTGYSHLYSLYQVFSVNIVCIQVWHMGKHCDL